jgi:2'-5' RNA ligase
MEEMKRLFFGAEIRAAWPKDFPQGRLIEESMRHMTLAFLGQTSLSNLPFVEIPRPEFVLGLAGIADHLVFLPKKHPRVVAAHVLVFHENQLKTYHQTLTNWLKSRKFSIDEREFLPHITIAREPFDQKEWNMEPFPFFISAVHLYESLGNLTYKPLWSHLLTPPFEEMEHTADIAFRIRGQNLQELHLHAQLALAFEFPSLLAYITLESPIETLDDLIMALNELVGIADQELGAPFKAVSFHGHVNKKNHYLEWEMIVDV